MRRIVLITTSPIREQGSEAAGSFVEDFAVELADRVETTLIAPALRGDEEVFGPLKVHRFQVPSLPLSLLKLWRLGDWKNILVTLKAGQAAVEQVVIHERPDHVFALWALPSGYWADRIRKKYGIPYSVWALGSDIWSLSRVPIVRGVLKEVLRNSRYCFADGFDLKADVERLSGRECHFLPSSRCLPVMAGKRMAEAPPYRLAFLGRWHPNKGVDMLLESLNRLEAGIWAKIEEIRICGGGPLQTAVEEGVDRLVAQGRPIVLKGYLDKREAAELLHWADFVLLPSRIESIPVIFSDALQARCPIIATPAGDLPRLFSEYRIGALSEGFDPRDFAAALAAGLAYSPGVYQEGIQKALDIFDVKLAAQSFLRAMKESGS